MVIITEYSNQNRSFYHVLVKYAGPDGHYRVLIAENDQFLTKIWQQLGSDEERIETWSTLLASH